MNYWEMPYGVSRYPKPQRLAKDVVEELSSVSGLHDASIVTVDKEKAPDTVNRRQNDPEIVFTDCDFSIRLIESSISHWKFVRCRFNKCLWDKVKFSSCIFDTCHFGINEFRNCNFLENCTFINISATAEYTRFHETAIDAKAFVSAITTNLNYLELNRTTPLYQLYRLSQTKQKIAMMLFNSTRNEGNLQYYFNAYEKLICQTLLWKIEEKRYEPKYIHHKPQIVVLPRATSLFIFLSIPARLEYYLISVAGFLTDWGKSLIPSLIYVAIVTYLFAVVYTYQVCRSVHALVPSLDGFIRSFNITSVAGYTAGFKAEDSPRMHLVTMANLFLGLFWYSLVVPVISRKILR